MKLLCLMPTYGRRKELLENSIACFESQTHQDKTLLIFDDLGTLQHTKLNNPNILIFSTNTRSQDVGTKYNQMLKYASNSNLAYESVVVWDDDDIYLEKHLEAHDVILQQHQWSKPSNILSAYHDPPQEESAAGRFHGSIAIRKSLLNLCAGWVETTRATFDQEMIELLKAIALPGNPCSITHPQYVYRWQTTQSGHCSGLMGNPNWYALYKPDSTTPIPTLTGSFDADTIRIKTYLLQSMYPQPGGCLSEAERTLS